MKLLRKILGGAAPSYLMDRIRTRRQADREVRQRAEFYRQFLGTNRLVFDVGANVGNRVAAFLSLDCKVVAVEPQPSCAALLSHRFAGDLRLTIVNMALGKEPGEIQLNWSANNDVLATVSVPFLEYAERSERFHRQTMDKSCTVKVTTLDNLISMHGVPDFIKIDVEGYEYEVLQGLSQSPTALSFEFTPDFQDHAIRCVDLCHSLGLEKFNISYGESMRLARSEWVTRVQMLRMMEALHGDTYLFGDIYACK